ncbi:serine/threonine protein phosphatase [Bacteroides sp. 214]|uniref:metallophosphoesterase family protein n=1 Tax=Bacteroides sp. 214 TaxID=2302935 RepID=UPI0013D52C84|nr:metallophosphatase domain-containing protein [Bacteroides sp. 214]NDW12015.1 serine/threonine protein phosphatase [Bacteroides sp. 214]
MKILHLSDTHNMHYLLQNLPDADIIVHSGDISFAGTESEVLDFIEWFEKLPYKYKIFVAGNHDHCLFGETITGLLDNCFYLCNSGIVVEGIKFYGVPLFMNDILSDKYDKQISKIPTDTDVLITHQPPYSVLDFSENIHYGDPLLLQQVLTIQPQYHLFGHIHKARGIEKIENTIFVNASLLDNNYELTNNPILLEM